MIKTTRAQREALFRVFQREFPNWISPGKRTAHASNEMVSVPTIQWRRFRSNVKGTIGCDGCVMIHWAGMWLGIEQDGYTHS